MVPSAFYADIAPLPIPLVNHLFQSYLRRFESSHDALYTMLQEIEEKRRQTYLYMDSFVRNRKTSDAPHELRFTPQWIRETLGLYHPDKRPIHRNTYNHWQQAGFIRRENNEKGKPEPDDAAALFILRMLLPGQRKILPDSMDPAEVWYCAVQQAPGEPISNIPISELGNQPRHAIAFTPWSGATWRGWQSVGRDQGAISFAGMRQEEDSTHYHLSIDDILLWRPDLGRYYHPKRGRHNDSVQALARLALTLLADEKI